jgi:hypothetical protein
MIRSFPPHPNPLPPGERGGHSSPQQSWGVFWYIFIKLRKGGIIYKDSNKISFGFSYVGYLFHHHWLDIGQLCSDKRKSACDKFLLCSRENPSRERKLIDI